MRDLNLRRTARMAVLGIAALLGSGVAASSAQTRAQHVPVARKSVYHRSPGKRSSLGLRPRGAGFPRHLPPHRPPVRRNRRTDERAGLRLLLHHDLATGRFAPKRYASRVGLVAGSSHPILESERDPGEAQITSLPLLRLRMLPALRGSRESLVRQNQRADEEGLRRIQDGEAVAAMFEEGELVGIPVSRALRVDPRLASNRRYCRPWTARFLTALARDYFARFHSPLQVNSAVRTVDYQRHLLRVNGNAAPAEGEIASPHLTGAAIDIGKKNLSSSQIGWMRAYLFPLQVEGKIDVEEEFQQACFHITVYTSYAPALSPEMHRIPLGSKRRHAVLMAARLP